MRCALIGAFAFPHVQGSQVFAKAQAHALCNEGWEVSILSYGGGAPAKGLDCHEIDRRWVPESARSGPRFKKPLADLALARKLVALDRERRFEIVLAHNAEAAAAAFHGLAEDLASPSEVRRAARSGLAQA